MAERPVSVFSGTWNEPVLSQFLAQAGRPLREIEASRTVPRLRAAGHDHASCGSKLG